MHDSLKTGIMKTTNIKRVYFSIFLLLTGTMLFSQNLINRTESEIKTIMKEQYKDFRLNTSTRNPSYRYLKYENHSNSETLLFFLSEEGVCTYYKYMGDYALYGSKIAELNRKYKKTGKNTWLEELEGEKYSIELNKGEWFFTLTTRKLDGN